MKTHWIKAYNGPFKESEARIVANELKAKKDIFLDANIRKRRNVQKYDVYIKVEHA